jgi:hypothetical protein
MGKLRFNFGRVFYNFQGYPYSPNGESPSDSGTGNSPSMESILREFLQYNITISHQGENARPTADNLNSILSAVKALSSVLGGSQAFCDRLKGVEFRIRNISAGGYGQAHLISLNKDAFDAWTVVHELGHAWDGVNKWNLSSIMQKKMNAGYRKWWYIIPHLLWPSNIQYWYYPGDGPPPCGIDRNFNAKEDFAEAVAALVFTAEAKRRATSRGWPYNDPARGYAYADYRDTPRGEFIEGLISS